MRYHGEIVESKQPPDRNFERARLAAEEEYRSFGNVRCPYFGEAVAFNAKGLEHVKFKSKRRLRERSDAFVRLRNLRLAPLVLKLSHTLQEKQTRRIFVEAKSKGRRWNAVKDCDYYGFIAILRDGNFTKRLKVVVRQIEGGEKHFWSVIPYWKSNKEIRMHSGNLEED